jgi:hypothetical protein
MKRAILGGFAIILLTSGCGASGVSQAEPASAPKAAPSPKTSLLDSCPQVEASLPKGLLPSAAKWQTFATELSGIAKAGDVDTENALEGLRAAVDTLASDPASGQPYLDADQALLEALDNLATRCKTVGSSALQ